MSGGAHAAGPRSAQQDDGGSVRFWMNLQSSLHPANIVGLNGVMHDLVRDGNSVLLVDHDTQILKESDFTRKMWKHCFLYSGYLIDRRAVCGFDDNVQDKYATNIAISVAYVFAVFIALMYSADRVIKY